MATGVLLVGGASTRFGAPKALARLGGETLAERAWRVLGEACSDRVAVGKAADRLTLPFSVVDDGTAERHPAAGILAGLKHSSDDVCVVLPVDCPAIRPATLRALAGACADAAVPTAGDPLPGAYRRTAVPELESCLAGRLPLAGALERLDVRTVDVDPWELANVNVPADLEAVARRERATAAATEVARRHGIDVDSPRILGDWNDTIVHLAPHPVVARVCTSWVAWSNEETVERELAVAAHAAANGGPSVRPTTLLPPGPHRESGLVLAFWELLDHEPGEGEPLEVAESLRAFHAALADYRGPLPPLAARHDRAEAVLEMGLPRLDTSDAGLLRRAFRELRGRATAGRSAGERVLHGSPHASNVLRTPSGLRWIDFDTVCRGPLEWDVAHLPPAAAAAFPEADLELVDLTRNLLSAEVAIWCWHSYGRAPEVDAAAHFHLQRIRDAF